MKFTKFTLLLFIAVLSVSPVCETKAQSVAVNFSLFQRELGPHGRWINNPRFGQVWIYNDAGFRPYYSNGHWEYTNYGWSWVSDFDWGWAPFHYGRWEYDPFEGWMWIPGYEWGSSWVSWSAYNGYYGWAPLGYGNNIDVAFGAIPYERWTFIPRQYICDRYITRYYISPERNRGFRNAVVINNFYEGRDRDGRFARGPERAEVERYTHNRIGERRIDDNERFGPRNNAFNRNMNDHPDNNYNRYNNNGILNNRQNDNRENNVNRPNNNGIPGNRQNDNHINHNNEQPGNYRNNQQPVQRPVRERPVQPVTVPRRSERRDEQRNNPVRRSSGENNPRHGQN